MKKTASTVVIVVLITFISVIISSRCKQKKDSALSFFNYEYDTTKTKYIIPLSDTTLFNSAFNLEDIVSSFKLITLKADSLKPQSTIAEIKKVFVIEDKYYAWDKKFSGLKVFNKEGDFLYMVGRNGKGNGAYFTINDVHLIDSSKLLLLTDNSNLNYFDLSGKHLKTLKLNIFATNFSMTTDRSLLFFINNNFSDQSKNYNLIATDNNENILNRYFRCDSDANIPSYDYTGFVTKNANNEILFSLPYDNKIWKYISGDFCLEYTFLIDNKIPTNRMAEGQKDFSFLHEYDYIDNLFFENKDYAFFSFKRKTRLEYGIFEKEQNRFNVSSNMNGWLTDLFSVPVGGNNNSLILKVAPEKIMYLKKKEEFMLKLKNDNRSLFEAFEKYNLSSNDHFLIICAIN